jgi:hypothetical protein
MTRQDPLIDVLPTIAQIWGHVNEITRQYILNSVIRTHIQNITPHLVEGIVLAINANYDDSNPEIQNRDAFLPQTIQMTIQMTIENMTAALAASTAAAVQALRRDNRDNRDYSSASTRQYLSGSTTNTSSLNVVLPSRRPPVVIIESLESPRSWPSENKFSCMELYGLPRPRRF